MRNGADATAPWTPALSGPQERVLRALYELPTRDCPAPTVREVMDAAGFSSTSLVTYHATRLQWLGLVSRAPIDRAGATRVLTLTDAGMARAIALFGCRPCAMCGRDLDG